MNGNKPVVKKDLSLVKAPILQSNVKTEVYSRDMDKTNKNA
eukprot:CAMPEP_0168338336 /NCGR_PEP_ID=MMETSP0213-20121227/12769_1 /TAXON_ID=151035 /ORGANISM="Euplotes harpa, Strain FSP1.4" /LENGTH=40 /DNA_ID= /DNA_START= /DNA_END= /DNA_ORIENTATION=